ncbi:MULTISPECIES: hypothetical protein [unclassified Flavobacterium]|uniref:hypothetical protein n=1 Tax=unclassified Flavobacterium TaxID=196869 RepID=UPI00361CD52B
MSKLGNPAITAVLATPEGQKALSNATHASSKAIDLAFTVLKVGIFCLGGYLIYNKFINGFDTKKEDSNYRPSNITTQGAAIRAENLYRAMYGPGDNFNKVATNLKGLNYNGYIRVYNAFGERRGMDLKKQNLEEWLFDNFTESEIKQLKFLTNNAF